MALCLVYKSCYNVFSDALWKDPIAIAATTKRPFCKSCFALLIALVSINKVEDFTNFPSFSIQIHHEGLLCKAGEPRPSSHT
jgi:hypothetical protein